jgi:hypothetical protein
MYTWLICSLSSKSLILCKNSVGTLCVNDEQIRWTCVGMGLFASLLIDLVLCRRHSTDHVRNLRHGSNHFGWQMQQRG